MQEDRHDNHRMPLDVSRDAYRVRTARDVARNIATSIVNDPNLDVASAAVTDVVRATHDRDTSYVSFTVDYNDHRFDIYDVVVHADAPAHDSYDPCDTCDAHYDDAA